MGRPMGLLRLAREIGDEPVVAEEIRDEHWLAERAKRVHAVQKIAVINGVADLQLAQGHFKHRHRSFALQRGFLDELILRAVEHVEHRVGERTKTAAFEQNGFFVEQFAGDDGLAIGGEHGGFRQPLLNKLERHEPVVHAGKCRAGKFDHVHLNPLGVEAIEQRADQRLRVGVLVKCGVNEIDANRGRRLPAGGAFRRRAVRTWMMIVDASSCGRV